MSSGNLEPGGDFSPIGTIATYANEIVAPALLVAPVKASIVVVILQQIPASAGALNARIFSLIP